MIQKRIFLLFSLLSISFLVCAIISSIFAWSFPAIGVHSYIILLATVVTVFLAMMLSNLYSRIYKIEKHNRRITIAILILITVIPRMIWNIFINTKPESDFLLYQLYAECVSHGIFNKFDPTYFVFPFKFGYPLTLGFIYKIFGSSLWTAKVFNIFLSVCLMLLLYWIGTKMFGEKAAIIASILFALWPSQIMFNSVLASEHVFMIFFTLAIVIFLNIVEKLHDKRVYFLSIVLGIVITFTQFIRPISLLLFPLFIIYIFFFAKQDSFIKQDHIIIKTLLKKSSILLVICTGYFISLVVLNSLIYQLIKVPIWKSSSGYNLLVGTNYDSLGRYNAEDEAIVREFHYNFDEVHSEATKRAVERISSRPFEFLRLIEKKYIIQWASDDYGFYWSTIYFEKETPVDKYLRNNYKVFYCITQVADIVIILFAAVGCFYSYKSTIYQANILMLIFLGLVAAFTFLEVQSRYHYPAVPFLILLAAYGMGKIKLTTIKDFRLFAA